jgi:hypothetical protein
MKMSRNSGTKLNTFGSPRNGVHHHPGIESGRGALDNITGKWFFLNRENQIAGQETVHA